jgi:hypothetical protein
MVAKNNKPKENGNGSARDRKRDAATSKKVPTSRARADVNGTGVRSADSKRKLTKKDYEKMTANELTLLAWEAVYANRHKRLT